ncbi:hypothetical protein [Mucilaginibacter psychrotolerans]|uniref:Uncharacterized protein n=1 Tax=Mucilaginibacter psychrotolerans TaxID=1524096 RepID=A0A4Y8S734_9SPHI|nr:hypothetical protein [Mucilaginibacter psychrotolerans]TFF34405.1 hypothetical protein E2R66_22280 [Mucilaginibacter psychrotolerans]
MDAQETKCFFFYGSYFISNPAADEYWMVDLPNHKLRAIDKDCYAIVESLNELKKECKEI